jgi:actin-related protein 8
MADPTAGPDDDVAMEDDDSQEPHGSKIIVIHPGSQYLRIGFANDALPKTVPMVIARKWKQNESEENGAEPLPKRIKIDHEVPSEPDKWFGEEVSFQNQNLLVALLIVSSGELCTRLCA